MIDAIDARDLDKFGKSEHHVDSANGKRILTHLAAHTFQYSSISMDPLGPGFVAVGCGHSLWPVASCLEAPLKRSGRLTWPRYRYHKP